MELLPDPDGLGRKPSIRKGYDEAAARLQNPRNLVEDSQRIRQVFNGCRVDDCIKGIGIEWQPVFGIQIVNQEGT